MRIILLGGLVLLCAAQARAEDIAPGLSQDGAAKNCQMEETAQISLSIAGTEADIKKIKPAIDQKAAEIKAVAAEAKISEVDLQSSNYNVYPNNSGGSPCNSAGGTASHQYNANFSFDVKPAEAAPELAALLTAKGYNASLNVNAYKKCQ